MSLSKVVLIIDDNDDIRRLLRMTLEFEDFDVVEATHGAEGLEMAHLRRPDMIICDVMMPGMSGHEVCQAVTMDPELTGIPVLMLSALDKKTDVDQARDAGARGYLTKPFSPTELMHAVRHLVGR
ncbi:MULTISPECIES: response regulator [Curvibacter]|jgi:CheY-like chemotaxis protein|uniref:response regulator n=1 Tax=Curvibacter TaxID=281915 RepID=UPI0003750129|nr:MULTISPECIES: response regulator [Curvibacter]MBV5295677.1 response regulator [Curvibacter lanceolatus]